MGPAPAAVSPGSTSKLLVGGFVVIALLVGMGVDFAAAQSKVTKTQKELVAMTDNRDAYKTQVDDRAAQQAADDAAVAKSQSDKQTADDAAAAKQASDAKAASDKAASDKAAADKATADRAAASQAAADQAAAAQALADVAKNTIPGDGIFAIGSDKAAGTYKTPGPAGGSCYYAVLSSPNGSGIDNIIDNNNISGPGIVTLKAGQYFETNRCSDWTKS